MSVRLLFGSKGKIWKASILAMAIIGYTVSVNAQSLIMTTYAGTGASGNSGDGGAAISARLSGPGFVAIDAANNLYISDYANNNIRKVSSTGIITTVAGNGTAGYSGDGGPATLAQLNVASGIAVDNSGNIYIADEFNKVVRKVDPSGIITTVAGTGAAGFSGDGGAATAAQLNRPTDVAVDHAGNLYISDNYNNVIRMVNTAGVISTFAGIPDSSGYTGNDGPATAAKISGVFGMGIDNAGNLYIGETFPQHVIRKINAAGIISLVAGDDSSTFTGDGMAATATAIGGAADIAFDPSGNLYFTEESKGIVRRIGPDGKLSTYAGNNYHGFGGDGGSPLHATLNDPIGIVFDLPGNLYIADISNNRIRKVGNAPVGINDHLERGNGGVYPNPCHGTFYVTTTSTTRPTAINVTDIMSRVVYECPPLTLTSDNIIAISLPSSLPAGLYVANITIDGNVDHSSLLLER